MGKKNKVQNLGKSLIRDRFGSSTARKFRGDFSKLHSENVNDGYDWACLNLQSVTEQSSFEEFLSTADLAGTEFNAEKLNIKFVNLQDLPGLLSKDEKKKVLEEHEKRKGFLKIPRRPKWDSSTTAQDLQAKEKEEFLEWRRNLSVLQESEGLILTPYEKNLEFWRQLWRVVERSDVVIQIVDARNPLLFRCEDLENYVKEIDPKKMNLILINKADFLTDNQRQLWAEYFTSINMRVAFFSAKLATESEKIEEESEEDVEDSVDAENDDSSDESNEINEKSGESNENKEELLHDVTKNIEKQDKDKKESLNNLTKNTEIQDKDDKVLELVENESLIKNSSELLTRDELILLFRSIYKEKTYMEGVTTIGMVGYPNVGKSSTINALLQYKKVSVSATPGKTKHFQTLFLDKDLLLCDCPGLVMPSFVCTKADMILNGILPIDQMRDHVPPVTLLATLIPKYVIEDMYGIMLPIPAEGEDQDRPSTAEEILNAYGYSRGFMTQNGQPDNPRTARYVLKDFVNGRLLYCVAPPTQNQNEFHQFPPPRRIKTENTHITPRMARIIGGKRTTSEELDKKFLSQQSIGVHARGVHGKAHGLPQNARNNGIAGSAASSVAGSMQNLCIEEKPWKKINKHCNKKKREKARRLYSHLDQH
ncbi:large subunit GTPase 1 homolog [Polistes fuscatus]|uniref:large subunit GTPase 1 homolog n=1 Tax=Polistes fuscatus TaxID=30207 RepID=UPI001CA9CB8A|nr:large subunit GTPase 1 homolog [Polistes fuscatus]